MGKWTDAAMVQREVMNTAAAMLTDEQAATVPTLYEAWKTGVEYAAGDRHIYDGVLYKCLQAHTSQHDWTPDVSPSLWAKVLIPDPTVIPEWEQPDSTNPYMKGDKVTYNGVVYVSTVDNNVWPPDEYGWEVVPE